MENAINHSLYNVTEVELVYRNKIKASERPLISSPSDAYKLLLTNWDMDRIELAEDFKILLLNRANQCLGLSHISRGGISGTVADPRIILVIAMKAMAVSIVLAHNHPSGNLTPSASDIELTKKIVQAGSMHDIKVYDHLIVTPDAFYSFAEYGLIP